MGSIDELKEINTKNGTRYYFNYIIKNEDFDLDNILIDEKSYENILVYDILHKTVDSAKLLHIRLDKVN